MKLYKILIAFLVICLSGKIYGQTVTIQVDSIMGCNPKYVNFSYTTTIGTVTSLLWNFGNDSTSTQAQPTAKYSQGGIFPVTLIVNGTDTATYSLILNPCLAVPKFFTPNGDNINDYLIINYDGKSQIIFKVFSRTGVQVYHTSAAMISWDGTYDSGDKALPGIYYYSAQVSGIVPEVEQHGFFYILY